MIDETRFSADEYEKQFFGFSSTEFCHDFKYFLKKRIEAALGEVESAIRTEIDDVSYDKEPLKSRIATLENIYIDAAKIPLEKFQTETRKIFAIPNNISLLPFQSMSCDDNDVIKLKEEVAELQNELLKEEAFIQALNQQNEVIQTMIKTTSSRLHNLEVFAKKSLIKNDEILKERQNALKNHYLQMLQYYFGDGEGLNAKIQDISNSYKNVVLVPGQKFF